MKLKVATETLPGSGGGEAVTQLGNSVLASFQPKSFQHYEGKMIDFVLWTQRNNFSV